MADQSVGCPDCVLGDQCKSMLQRPAWFICEQCGHVAIPEDVGFKCTCRNWPKVEASGLIAGR
jgi:hypothetical protein